jgi:hypothetical protein
MHLSIIVRRRGKMICKQLSLLQTLLIRQENSDIVSHPFPQKTRKWMGHLDSITLTVFREPLNKWPFQNPHSLGG